MTELLRYQIALSLIKGIGPKLARNLVAYVGDVKEVFKEKESTLAKIPGIGPVVARSIKSSDVMARAEEEIDFIQRHQIKAVFYTSDEYPKRLSYCEDAPLLLYIKGDNYLDGKKVLGVVGTRKASDDAKINCEKLIGDLAIQFPDLVIISGLAYGVDICAHQAALKNNLNTYGVLAHGLDRIYPSLHRNTAAQMVEQGGLITEFVTQTNPDKPNFVKRNRIVAGLVDALVVVESGVKGGAVITARIASSYNRDVLAYPGSVSNELAKGCNYLIKSNIGGLIEDAQDLMNSLGWEGDKNHNLVQRIIFKEFNNSEEEVLYDILYKNKEMTANELSLESNFPVSKVSASMLSLEFAGLIKSLPGNAFRII
ncbi:DNA-processing protein DprA [Carboxylicivirga linearis]|uniref:DNA-processing protein DprA n=1 Tax=Carboxylicivirga linearis TaxID=1628157 RepID=A0ABS5JSP7_9BACT|nr:DNA-processing protein DprA [Carboxylicivirga linearis]